MYSSDTVGSKGRFVRFTRIFFTWCCNFLRPNLTQRSHHMYVGILNWLHQGKEALWGWEMDTGADPGGVKGPLAAATSNLISGRAAKFGAATLWQDWDGSEAAAAIWEAAIGRRVIDRDLGLTGSDSSPLVIIQGHLSGGLHPGQDWRMSGWEKRSHISVGTLWFTWWTCWVQHDRINS